MRRFIRKLNTFRHFDGNSRNLLLASIAWLVFARVGLWLLSFRVLEWICDACGKSTALKLHCASALDIAWAIEIGSRYVPRATCLVRAMAARILLRRNSLPGIVYVGVAQNSDLGFKAHAWVESQGFLVCGGMEAPSYTPILVRDSKCI